MSDLVVGQALVSYPRRVFARSEGIRTPASEQATNQTSSTFLLLPSASQCKRRLHNRYPLHFPLSPVFHTALAARRSKLHSASAPSVSHSPFVQSFLEEPQRGGNQSSHATRPPHSFALRGLSTTSFLSHHLVRDVPPTRAQNY